jgi:tRNA (guanine9-N1)-methyltransferase
LTVIAWQCRNLDLCQYCASCCLLDDLKEPLSKRAQKRLIRDEKRKEHWKEKRQVERAKKKEQTKEKKRLAQEEGVPNVDKQIQKEIHRMKKRKDSEVEFAGSIVIDCGFDDKMVDKEVKALASQLSYTYASNIRLQKPYHLHFTNYGGTLEKVLEKYQGHENWNVR